MSSNHYRSWSDTAFYNICSESTLFDQACPNKINMVISMILSEFFFFFQKIGFDISNKLSPETNWIKCQSLLSGKNKTFKKVIKWLFTTAGGVQETKPNIFQSSLISRSRSVILDGSEQGASWQMCVWSFICLEALIFEKRSWTHRLNIVDVDNNPMPPEMIPLLLLVIKAVTTMEYFKLSLAEFFTQQAKH